MKSLLPRMAKPLLYLTYLVFTSTLLLFTVIEYIPGLGEPLHDIRYYAQRREYRPHPTLVFVPNRVGQPGGSLLETEFIGDAYSPEDGVAVSPQQYRATYTPEGFRRNSSAAPFEVLVLGDSYVEIGEDDTLTVSELLKQVSGMTTFNLGRGWYGPYQYLEFFKEYGARLKPRYALFCFFDGNDLEDTKQYLRWLNGKSYYTFVLSTKSYLGRYFTAFRDTYKFLLKRLTVWNENVFGRENVSLTTNETQGPQLFRKSQSRVPTDLAFVRGGGEAIPMRFNYWNRPMTTEQLVQTKEWQALREILIDFKRMAANYGTVPVIVFIPNKVEVYGSLFLPQSGENFLKRIEEQLRYESTSHDAFVALTREITLPLVDLLPVFRNAAGKGELLFYQFDTHWNKAGRKLAAETIAAELTRVKPEPQIGVN